MTLYGGSTIVLDMITDRNFIKRQPKLTRRRTHKAVLSLSLSPYLLFCLSPLPLSLYIYIYIYIYAGELLVCPLFGLFESY